MPCLALVLESGVTNMTLKRTISGMIGTGSLAHNRREFIAENVDSDRVQLNICYQNENLKEVYKELFDDAVEEKQRLIDEVVHLDEGFEIMYEKLARELEGNRERYAAQIRELQKKVSRVTELSVTVQAQEARNKKLIESYFARERAGIGQRRKNAKSAYDYYKSMSGAGYVAPQMYDNKK